MNEIILEEQKDICNYMYISYILYIFLKKNDYYYYYCYYKIIKSIYNSFYLLYFDLKIQDKFFVYTEFYVYGIFYLNKRFSEIKLKKIKGKLKDYESKKNFTIFTFILFKKKVCRKMNVSYNSIIYNILYYKTRTRS